MVVALMGYNMDLWEEKNGVRTAAPNANRQFFSRFLAKLETFESLEATFFLYEFSQYFLWTLVIFLVELGYVFYIKHKCSEQIKGQLY